MFEEDSHAVSARLDIEQRLRDEFEAWLARRMKEVKAFERKKFEEKTLPALIEEAEEDLRDKFEEKPPGHDREEEAQTGLGSLAEPRAGRGRRERLARLL